MTTSARPLRQARRRSRVGRLLVGGVATLAATGTLAGIAVGVAAANPPATPTPTFSLVGSTHVLPGGGVHMAGECTYDSGGRVYSPAFVDDVPNHDYGGQGSEDFQTTPTGHFDVWATVDPRQTPGTYAIHARCGGGIVPVTVNLTVDAFPNPVPPTAAARPAATADPAVKAAPAFTG